jgi:hypothetical protein
MNAKGKKKRATLNVTAETKAVLTSIRRTGQSYNGLIQEMIALWKKENGSKVKRVK